MNIPILNLIYLITLSLTASHAEAGHELSNKLLVSPLFGDGAILQHGRLNPIWGQSVPGETIMIHLDQVEVNVKADSFGNWQATLPAMPASFDLIELRVSNTNNESVSTKVRFGEVWLCSGQSNMAWSLARLSQSVPDFTELESVYIFTVPEVGADTPQSTIEGKWSKPSVDHSALAVYFGEALSRRLGYMPVGLIVAARGGTPIESWMGEVSLRNSGVMEGVYQAWDRHSTFSPEEIDQHRAVIQEFRAANRLWTQSDPSIRGERPTRPTPLGLADPNHPRRPSRFYNGMIAPLRSLALGGVVWYQGEGNVWRARQYRTLLPTLIRNWRDQFKREDLPFAIVELASWETGPGHRNRVAWLRDAQAQTAAGDPRVALIPTFDLQNPDRSIHPTTKQPVGDRVAKWAAACIDGDPSELSGPRVETVTSIPEDHSLIVTLVAQGKLTPQDNTWPHWEIADSTGSFLPATVEQLDDLRIKLSNPAVHDPVHIRFAWSDWPEGAGIYDDSRLPLRPFRTDERPDPTQPDGEFSKWAP